jgi:hypothetical protein
VSKTSVGPEDIEMEDETKALLKGGFHYGANRRDVPYIPPRPLLNHGPHRCELFIAPIYVFNPTIVVNFTTQKSTKKTDQ